MALTRLLLVLVLVGAGGVFAGGAQRGPARTGDGGLGRPDVLLG